MNNFKVCALSICSIIRFFFPAQSHSCLSRTLGKFQTPQADHSGCPHQALTSPPSPLSSSFPQPLTQISKRMTSKIILALWLIGWLTQIQHNFKRSLHCFRLQRLRVPNFKWLKTINTLLSRSALSTRTFCDDELVHDGAGPTWQPFSTYGSWALAMWLVQ